MSFLTVEDINSVFKQYEDINEMYVLDTSDIENGAYYYDFITVVKTANNIDFIIDNVLWTGGYYFTDLEDNYISQDATYNSDDNILSLNTSIDVKLHIYLCGFALEFNVHRLKWTPFGNDRDLKNCVGRIDNDWIYYTLRVKNKNLDNASNMLIFNGIGVQTYPLINEVSQSMEFTKPYNNNNFIVWIGTSIGVEEYLYDYYFRLKGVKIRGDILYYGIERYGEGYTAPLKENTEVLIDFNNGEAGSNITGTVEYLNKKEDFINTFNIDLAEYNKTKPFIVTVSINETSNFIANTYIFKCYPVNKAVTTKQMFLDKLQAGSSILLGADINLGEDVYNISKDVVIDGGGYKLTGSFIVQENINILMKNLTADGLTPFITQQINSKVVLKSCTFEQVKENAKNVKGAIIHCKENIADLDVEDDFITEIDNCTFKNNGGSITSGGQLTITNSTFIEDGNNRRPIIYQVDGSAVLFNNIFDIDDNGESDNCANHNDIGLGHCLFLCGENARINNYSATDLIKNDKYFLNKNKAHIYLEYFHNNECIVLSPVLNNEEKAYCFAVTSQTRVYRQNVQVTNKADNNANTIRKITYGGD